MRTIRDELAAEAQRHAQLLAMLPETDELMCADADELAAMLDDVLLISAEMCECSRRQMALLQQVENSTYHGETI